VRRIDGSGILQLVGRSFSAPYNMLCHQGTHR